MHIFVNVTIRDLWTFVFFRAMFHSLCAGTEFVQGPSLLKGLGGQSLLFAFG